jgi:thioredoxin reductase (NADPH)
MFDYEAIIIGAGPAGLTAALYLARANRRILILEKESPGGPITNYELIENYPGFAEGVDGASLAAEMVSQVQRYDTEIQMGEVIGIDLFSSCRLVQCASGSSYSGAVVIIAGGAHPRRLNVPGEEKLAGRGVFNCAFCDGSQLDGQVVAVCGGGDAGITGALYLAKQASRVILIEAMPDLTASAVLRERALANSKIAVRTGIRVEEITGKDSVEGMMLADTSGKKELLLVAGVLVSIGLDPNTGYLDKIVPLDNARRIIINERMETKVPFILAAGDIRSGSAGQIVTAAGDGAAAAITAEHLLQELG